MITLTDLYARVPSLECQGKCAESCGPIMVAAAEEKAMRKASSGKSLTFNAQDMTCGYLKDGRCSVYAKRPLICRLWGAAEGMTCPFGCKPARLVSRTEGHVLLDALRRVGGKIVMSKPVE